MDEESLVEGSDVETVLVAYDDLVVDGWSKELPDV